MMMLLSKQRNYWLLTQRTIKRTCLVPHWIRKEIADFGKRNIFLGFAFDKQNKFSEAERAYDAATRIKSNDPQAWQGLIKLFEKQGSSRVDAYQIAALKLAEVYRDVDDKYKCQDVVDKFIAFAKSQGTRQQQRRSLEILLPTSSIYNYLEGRIPHPSHTYQKIVEITEADEKERTNKEIGERRTRLGAKISQVTLEVQREILRNSPLEDLYSKIIDWSNDDEIRRQYEEKLLQRCYDTLVVSPLSEMNDKRVKVEKLARDMVIIKHPYRLAWEIAIEWQDNHFLADWDPGVLREYCDFFPETGLAKVLDGFMNSEISPFPARPPPPKLDNSHDSDESEDEDGEGGVKLELTAEDRLLLMTEGMSDAPSSILAHRIMGEYYAFLDEHETVVELMRACRKLVSNEAQKTGIDFKNASQSLTALLGTALVFYQSPKNHPEAKDLFNSLLSYNPTSTPALIGTGLIYEEEEDFPAAIDFLQRALQKDPENIRVRAEAAWVKALNGDYERSRDELEDCLPKIEGQDLRTRDLRAQTQYRIGVCIWNIDKSTSARKNRSGAYQYFLAALKSNLNYAPAYTSLGIFYCDYSKDKKRARKCFQKAFELSASEVEAAERLARAFADQGEWDLVEIVAQRVVDSGKVRPSPGSKKKGISWPFAALGVAELNKQDYAKSIVSFQSALRILPSDYHSWVGLGESYHNSGRYIAATKAFTHAEIFEEAIEQQKSGDTWFAKYMLANVKRELGQYDDSVNDYMAVLKLRPMEYGVSIALIQTLVESAWDCVDKGLFGQATDRARKTIEAAQDLPSDLIDAFNFWKAMGDACSVFSWVQGHMVEFPHNIVKEVLNCKPRDEAFGIFTEVDGVGPEIVYSEGLYPADETDALNFTRCLHAAILCHKCAIQAAAHDLHAQAVAYFNLGWAEYRAHICLRDILKKKSTRYLKTAVRCFKRAIELEAGNAEFWNALGVVTSEVAPKIAQHSFVRSLFLNERSAQTWTNLGTLYLLQNDSSLANEAFTRAQSADPDFAHAWLGQGLIALLFGDAKEARLLFTHAIEISESSSQLTKRQYTLATFDHLLKESANSSITDLVHPIFALNQLQFLAPGDLPSQHLAGLFFERVDNVSGPVGLLQTISRKDEHGWDVPESPASLSASLVPQRVGTVSTAVGLLEMVCAKVEADYEVTESPTSLSRFALAKADLARSQLAAGLYGQAIDSAETALQLSAENSGNQLNADARRKCRLSAQLTIGLAHYHNHNAALAVDFLKAGLEDAKGNPDGACLLAQVLWATGDEKSRDQAREQLFDCVEQHPGHVQSVLLLGAIALLDGDLESLEAVAADLVALRTDQTISNREQAMVGEILRAVAALSGDKAEQATLAEVQSEVLLFPNQPHGWGRLADIGEDDYAAEMALRTAIKAVPPRGDLDAVDLAQAFAGTEKVGDAQKAIMIAPWKQEGWAVLSNSIA
jgi:superkiller protein 3